MSSIEKTSVDNPLIHAQKTVGTTAVQLTGQGNAIRGILVKALTDNEGTVYVGTSKVTTSNGFPLEGGDSIELEVSDPSKIYAVASDADQVIALVIL